TAANVRSFAEDRPADRRRKQIVEKEMHLRDPTCAVAAAAVDGDDRLHSELHVLPRPDDSRIDRPGRSARAAIERGRHRELDDGNHPVEGLTNTDVLHEAL